MLLDTTTIRQELLTSVGVTPSSHWLEDCCQCLQQQQQAAVTANAVLPQILHHDLRDVVRELEGDENNNRAAAALRQGVVQSRCEEHSYHASLPADFQLLVQIEELVDVSANAQARAEHGPTSQATPTTVGNQNHRCLKMVYSDGYYHENDEVLMAMEISPIPSLSVKSTAGMKVLLHGAIRLRHGVALWDRNSVCVLGGDVPELARIQQAAYEQAKRVAGVGIDPTIKALIWNNQQTGEEEPQDESEFGSRDLTPRGPDGHPPMAPAVTPLPRPEQSRPRPSGSTTNSQDVIHIDAEPSPPHNRFAPQVTTNSMNPPQAGVMDPRPSPAQNRSNHPAASPFPTTFTTALLESNVSNRSGSVQRLSIESSASTGSHGGDLSTPGPSASERQSIGGGSQDTTAPGSWRLPGSATAQRQSTSAPQATMLPQPAFTSPTKATQFLSRNPYASRNRPSQSVPATAPPPRSTNQPASSMVGPSSNGTDRITFADLVAIASSSPEAYRQSVSKVWIVDLQQVGPKEYFNIEKRKKRPKGDDRKYEYVMSAKFRGTDPSASPVSFKVASSILESYFELSPGEMRQLSKSDKARANDLVREGGKQVQADFYQVRQYKASLLPPEEGDPTKNLDHPLFLLQEKLT